jgi:hypothetical protein
MLHLQAIPIVLSAINLTLVDLVSNKQLLDAFIALHIVPRVVKSVAFKVRWFSCTDRRGLSDREGGRMPDPHA